MREIVLLLARLFCTLHTSCKLFLTLPHKSHFKDSFGLNRMKASAYSYSLKNHVLTDFNLPT